MNEFEHLIDRNYQPYSLQHRAIYNSIAELLRNKPANILEIGFGIGYGIEKLLEANCIKEYIGIEPDKQSFEYVYNKFKKEKLYLYNYDWLNIPENIITPQDFSLCIEVIEHVDNLEQFLLKLYNYTKYISFISTPDKNTDKHGKFTKSEIRNILKNIGFKDVVDIEWQLPHTIFIMKK